MVQSVVILAKLNNDFILINQYRKPINDYTIQLPGGGVSQNEPLEEAAKREFLEETGYHCGVVTFLSKLRPASWISNEVTYVFYTEDVIEYIGQTLESHENIEVLKMSTNDLLKNIETKIFDSKLTYACLQCLLEGIININTKGLTS